MIIVFYGNRLQQRVDRNYNSSARFDYTYIFQSSDNDKLNFSPAVSGVITYFSFFLLLNTLLPISLMVSLEVTKLLQSTMVSADNQMYYEPTKQKTRVLNMMIHEELGKIEYIFTDKTGTLTSNSMKFIGCCVGISQYSAKELQSTVQNVILTLDPEY